MNYIDKQLEQRIDKIIFIQCEQMHLAMANEAKDLAKECADLKHLLEKALTIQSLCNKIDQLSEQKNGMQESLPLRIEIRHIENKIKEVLCQN